MELRGHISCADPGRAGVVFVKVAVTLTPTEVETLRSLATRRGISMTEVIRRALAFEKFMWDSTAQGDKVLLEASDGTVRQVLVSK